MTENARGALLMMASMASFTLNDVFLKALSDELPLFQALTLRGIGTTLLLLVFARRLGRLSFDLPRRDWGLIALRTGAEIGAAVFFLTALFNMPLANATAILQVLPLTVTLAGAVFLGEAVGWRRLTAILVGFVGVMLIIRPGAEGFTIYSVYVLIAVGFVTLRDLTVRRMSRQVPSLTVALCASAGVAGASALASLGIDWQPISRGAALELGAAAVMIIGGYMFSVMAMRVGEVAVVTPFRYTALLFALVLGFVVFGDWPDPLTLVGAAIVVAMGVYTFTRERAIARSAPVSQRPR